MKKILSTIVALAIAGTASAASLNWTVAGVNQPETTTPAQGYAVYLFILGQSSNFGVGTTTVADVTSLLESGATVVKNGEKVTGITDGTTTIGVAASGLTNASGLVSGATGYNGNSFGAGDSLKAFAVVFDAADASSAGHYIVTDEKSVSWGSSTGAKPLAFGNMASSGKTWVDVPEPSVALMGLLGLGMMLKRRRA